MTLWNVIFLSEFLYVWEDRNIWEGITYQKSSVVLLTRLGHYREIIPLQSPCCLKGLAVKVEGLKKIATSTENLWFVQESSSLQAAQAQFLADMIFLKIWWPITLHTFKLQRLTVPFGKTLSLFENIPDAQECGSMFKLWFTLLLIVLLYSGFTTAYTTVCEHFKI